MHRASRRRIRSSLAPHPVHLLALALAITALVFASCGDDDDDEGDVATPAESSEEIVIETQITFPRDGAPNGEILGESTIGDAPFCPGGTFTDQPGGGGWFNEKTIECEDGTLEIGFSPGEPSNQAQKGPWKLLSGTGAYEGWGATGEMEVTFASQTEGRETFRGTVAP